ncbi:MAG: amidohydrolase, partial [Synergistales bacterium]|nr:amidohydrolase [Synergistales bacterium]
MRKANDLIKQASEIETDILKWRREIHAYPELAFEERRTAEIILGVLDKLEIGTESGIAKTGIVGRLRGNVEGPTIGFRADMDALPIQEETNLPFSSKVDGVMHACCHDGHVAMLLGAATLLRKNKSSLMGDVVFVFQPAEEGQAGAREMISTGVFERFSIDALFGHHVMPGVVPPECILGKKGILTANSDRFSMVIHGRGGHASMPQLAQDPVVAMGSMINGINTIISRNTDPSCPAVVSIGEASSGSSYNAIPNQALIKGSIRTTDTETQTLVKKRLFELTKGISISHDVEITCQYQENYPSVSNDPDLTSQALSIAKPFFGKDKVIGKDTPFMFSEDFAFFGQAIPSCFLL